MRKSLEKNAIQQQMEEVRRDLDESVQDTVEGVRELSDWRSYMKAYPWVGLGAAFAVGYLFVLWLLCGVALGFACFPMGLAAMALLLIQVFEISYAAGFLIAVVAGAVLSGLLSIIGWFQVCKQMAVLQRSQQELVRNLRWMKKILERDRLTRSKNNPKNAWRTKA